MRDGTVVPVVAWSIVYTKATRAMCDLTDPCSPQISKRDVMLSTDHIEKLHTWNVYIMAEG